MARFSAESLRQLSTCHPDLQVLFNEVIKHFDCKVLEGHRGQEAQHEAFASVHSKLDWPHGNHNQLPSLAVDVAPFPIEWGNFKRFYWFAGFVLGIAVKLKNDGFMGHSVRYGGDWNENKNIDDEKFRDLVHFELIK